jgi:DNA-binding NarL/FixJ family response regulator
VSERDEMRTHTSTSRDSDTEIDRGSDAEIDHAIAETTAAMAQASGAELTALGNRLVELLDRRQMSHNTAADALRLDASRLDRAVRALGGASSSRELMQRACTAVGEVCRAERVVLSGIEEGRAIPVTMHAAGQAETGRDGALPSAFTIMPESSEARALRSGTLPYPAEPAPPLRPLFPNGCAIVVITIAEAPAAMLHIGAEIGAGQHDSITVLTEVLGTCFERLGLTARRAKQLDLLRASARSWASGLDEPPPPDTPVDPGRPGPPPVEPLTDRENDVLRLILTGASNSAIATELVITIDTVKSHVKRILRKLGATNRAELIATYNGVNVTPLPNSRRSR